MVCVIKMNEEEITRLMKDLLWLLQNMSECELEEQEEKLEERLEAIKSELGSWFIDGYPLYMAA